MRLLNTQTLKLTEFSGSDIPEYAILSHTWGPDGEEVSFKDIQEDQSTWAHKQSATKVTDFCKLADTRGYDWVWIDTCCIDKSSSTELSEAINSMYQWYKESHVCYAYLSDVANVESFNKSRWFTRGWTLQELLAPRMVEFYDKNWLELGNKIELSDSISEASGIETDVLHGTFQPNKYTAAVKMSWASKRMTKRAEDVAYSLLGLFDVNMPLLYGEGSRAFQRLQEEILKVTEDYTLFTWVGPTIRTRVNTPVLASSPSDFKVIHYHGEGDWTCKQLEPVHNNPLMSDIARTNWAGGPRIKYLNPAESSMCPEPPRITGRGLLDTLPFIESFSPGMVELNKLLGCITSKEFYIAFLYLRIGSDMVCQVLQQHDILKDRQFQGQYYRAEGSIRLVRAESISIRLRTIYLQTKWPEDPNSPSELQTPNNYPTACILSLISAGSPKLTCSIGKIVRAQFLIQYDSSYIHAVALFNTPKFPACFLFESGPGTSPPSESDMRRIYQSAYHLAPQIAADLHLRGGDKVHATMRLRPKGWEQRQQQSGLLTATQWGYLQQKRGIEKNYVYSLEVTIPKKPLAKLEVIRKL